MKEQTNKSFSAYLALSVFATFLLLVSFSPQSADAITVGPVKLEYSIDPGTTATGEMYIKNEEGAAKTFYPSIEEFTEQNGAKVFTKNDSLIGQWMTTEDSVTLNPGEERKIKYTLDVPQDAPPGGQFAVVWWGTSPTAGDPTQQVSIQARAGILVYINVSGDITESAKISKFDTAGSKRLFGKSNVQFDLVISNEGNVYIKPTGSIEVTSIFGSKVASLPINEKGLQILPRSFRSLTDQTWTGSFFSLGPYKAKATVAYGDDKKITSSMWVWVFPVKLILILLGVLVVSVCLLSVFFKFYNKWLLSKHDRK